LALAYCVEPEPNIARARNLAIRSSTGDYVAFIDDDEFPESDWLQRLFDARARFNASGVLAPVRPYFETEPPKWLRDGKFFDRPEHETGFVLDWNECRTGNVLFAKSILEGDDAPFDVKFNTAGRMVRKGCVFVWCQEAAVHEVVPASRCNRRYLLKRALLRGSNFSKHPTGRVANAARSLVAVPCYAVALPVFALFGQHVFLKYLIKLLDHASRLLSYIGLPVVSERHT
jgi:succinoglycan biosynthesis protein ExoM